MTFKIFLPGIFFFGYRVFGYISSGKRHIIASDVHNFIINLFVVIHHPLFFGRTFQVQYGETISTTRTISAGVPQGSALGPLLYTLYTADIPQKKGTTLATFADDTAILSTDPDRLQKAVDQVTAWTKRWKINQSK